MDKTTASVTLYQSLVLISSDNIEKVSIPKFIEAFTFFNSKNKFGDNEDAYYPFMEDIIDALQSNTELQERIARYYGVRVSDVCFRLVTDSRDPMFNRYYAVVGNLVCDDISNMKFTNLMYIEGNLIIKNCDNLQFTQMSDVGTNLDISCSSMIELPELIHIENDFKIDNSTISDVSSLEDVDGNFVIEDSPLVNCPKLIRVGKKLICSNTQKGTFVNLRTVDKQNITNIKL